MRFLPIVLSTFFLLGCMVENRGKEVVRSTNEERDIAVSLKNASQDDLELMYKQFCGLAEYIRHTDGITTTANMLKVVDNFQKEYNWDKGQYPKFTDAVEDFLKDEGYTTPKKIVDVARDEKKEVEKDELIEDLMTIANGVKLAIEK